MTAVRNVSLSVVAQIALITVSVKMYHEVKMGSDVSSERISVEMVVLIASFASLLWLVYESMETNLKRVKIFQLFSIGTTITGVILYGCDRTQLSYILWLFGALSLIWLVLDAFDNRQRASTN